MADIFIIIQLIAVPGKMIFKRHLLLLLFIQIVYDEPLFGQHTPSVDSLPSTDMTISYSIEIKKSKKSGIEEMYNGGNKTVFISDDLIRIRLVSLMRVQSIFYRHPGDSLQKAVAIVKESGKDKYKTYLTLQEWKEYNRKYDSLQCYLTEDSATILGYPCRKAILFLKDGRDVTVYYTDSLKNKLLSLADPLFSGTPGLILQYEYETKKGNVKYTATDLNYKTIDRAVFHIPTKGIVTRKHISL